MRFSKLNRGAVEGRGAEEEGEDELRQVEGGEGAGQDESHKGFAREKPVAKKGSLLKSQNYEIHL